MNGSLPAALPPPPPSALYANAETSEARSGSLLGYLMLLAPYGLATAVASMPLASYLVAWLGSWMILVLTLGGYVRPLPGGSAFDQVMRPIVLTQLLFAGYNFMSSVFYVADLNGFFYLQRITTVIPPGAMEVTAQAQRYYVLAHGSIAVGMLAAMDYRRSGEWAVRPLPNPALTALWVSLFCLVVGKVLGGRSQFGIRIEQIGLVASVLSLGLAIPTRRAGTMLLGLGIYGLNMTSAFLSGWKEEVLVMVLLLAVFVYPYAKRTVTIGAPIVMVLLLAFLPTYVDVVRGMSWSRDKTGSQEARASSDEAASVALDVMQSGEIDIAENNWEFLTHRLSQISMFVKYITVVEATNAKQPNGGYYGTQILEQTVGNLIPRAFWEDKPVTEEMVMERVYAADVVSENSTVSAKPQYVVDGYLSWGALGVLLSGLAFGLIASWASRACERWFGGYFWGSGLIYTAMFAVLWKGSSFEYFFNTILWSFVLLIPLFWFGRMRGLLVHSDALAADEAPEPDEELEPGRELQPEAEPAETLRPARARRRHWAVT